MATECYSQLGFGFQPKLVVDFAGGTLTTTASWPSTSSGIFATKPRFVRCIRASGRSKTPAGPARNDRSRQSTGPPPPKRAACTSTMPLRSSRCGWASP